MDKDKIIQDLIEQVVSLTTSLSQFVEKSLYKDKITQDLIEQIASLTTLLSQAKRKISELELEIAELKSRLNSNSRNSSRPPSSDGYKKKPAFPRQKKGKQGGQEGHSGGTLHQTDQPDYIVDCKP